MRELKLADRFPTMLLMVFSCVTTPEAPSISSLAPSPFRDMSEGFAPDPPVLAFLDISK